MGFFDSVSEKFSHGKESVSRSVSSQKLKSQIGDVNKRRQQFAAQLGASLYEATRTDPAMRAGRESLYDGIAACDAERERLQAQLASIEAAQAGSTVLVCPRCHSHVMASDRFCAGCGLAIEEVLAANPQIMPAQRPVQGFGVSGVPGASGASQCPQCGAPIQPGDAFCMSCGLNLQAQPAAPTAPSMSWSQTEAFARPLESHVSGLGDALGASESGPKPNQAIDDVAESKLEEAEAAQTEPKPGPDPEPELTLGPESPIESDGPSGLQPRGAAAADEPSSAEDLAAKTPAAEDSPARPGSYTCPRCGTQVMAQSKFCGGCGLPIEYVKAGMRA